VLVLTPSIFNDALSKAYISLKDIRLLVFDEAHHCRKRHVYAQIMEQYHRLDKNDRPRVFGMTASPVNLKLSHNEATATNAIVEQILQLERAMDAKVVTISDLTEVQMVSPGFQPCPLPLAQVSQATCLWGAHAARQNFSEYDHHTRAAAHLGCSWAEPCESVWAKTGVTTRHRDSSVPGHHPVCRGP
jgi:hypothetical protein